MSFSSAAIERVSRSIKPGATIMPFTSSRVSPGAGLNRPISAIFPSRMRRLPATRGFPVPSMIQPFIRTRFSANAVRTKTDIKRNNRTNRMLHSAALCRGLSVRCKELPFGADGDHDHENHKICRQFGGGKDHYGNSGGGFIWGMYRGNFGGGGPTRK